MLSQLPKDMNFYIGSNHFKEDCSQRDLQISSLLLIKFSRDGQCKQT